ncbi:MAG: hypothetical protein KDD61_12590 [Bdellovibrionales bacterium]|nr:hypothetical protein [Bdellovibrionales bacterium]
MRYFVRVLIVVLSVSVLFLSCAQKSEVSDGTSQWRGKMDTFAAVIEDLFPLIMSQQEFNNPDNFERIEADVNHLSKLAHVIEGDSKRLKMDSIGSDPSVLFIAKSFQREISRAQMALADGKRGYAQSVLKRTTAYCVQCHSRGNYGVEFARWRDSKRFEKLDPIEKAELYSAIREYDAAMDLYNKILADEKLAKKKTFVWEKAAMNALNLAVRVKQSPKEGLAIVGQITSTPRVAAFLKEDAKAWQKSLLQWKNEKLKKDSDKLSTARSLIEKAVRNQGFFADKSSQVEYLRATTLLHDNLRQDKKPPRVAESLYLLGRSYDALNDGAQDGISDLYFEACIEQLPHSKLAMQCFRRYESNIYFGFAGSGGLYVPPDVSERLQALKKLAQ